MSDLKYANALLAELDRFKDSKAKALVAKCGDIRAEITRVKDAAITEAKELLSEADFGALVASLEKAAPTPAENTGSTSSDDDAADASTAENSDAATDAAAPAPAGAPETAVPAKAPEQA